MSEGTRAAACAHEHRVARRLEARGMPGLADALVALHGRTIADRWRVDSLYAVGAEGAVYLATDVAGVAAPVVVKIPLLPYHRGAELSSSLLRRRRDDLREEARNLARAASPFLPATRGLHEFVNPLLDAARGGAFAEPDVALVMERLPGLDADLWLSRVHRSGLPREILRRRLDRVVVILLQGLRDLEQRGFFYADLRPGNLRIMGRPLRRARLLDAGSLVDVGDASGRFPHVPHYLPPELFERHYLRHEPILPSAAVQAVMAGRTLFEVATGCVPVPGQLVRPGEQRGAVSPVVADVVDGLASGSFSSVVPALRYLGRRMSSSAPRPARPAVSAPVAAVTPPAPPPDAWWRRVARRWARAFSGGSRTGTCLTPSS